MFHDITQLSRRDCPLSPIETAAILGDVTSSLASGPRKLTELPAHSPIEVPPTLDLDAVLSNEDRIELDAGGFDAEQFLDEDELFELDADDHALFDECDRLCRTQLHESAARLFDGLDPFA